MIDNPKGMNEGENIRVTLYRQNIYDLRLKNLNKSTEKLSKNNNITKETT